MKYVCEQCGKEHEELPSIGFISPFYYQVLSDEDKLNIAELNDDFCVIEHAEQTDFFIRVVINLKLTDSCEVLNYGVWVSLSEKSFLDYSDSFGDNVETAYFGYLSSLIPGYDNTLNIKMSVHTNGGNLRPEIFPHDSEAEHPFVQDYIAGISLAEAQRRIAHAFGE